MPWRCGLAALRGLTGKASGVPSAWPRHAGRSGQSRHLGLRGVQIAVPRSIIAWAKSPASASGVIASAAARIAALPAGNGSAIANSRATTRSTLASTTTARRPKAIAATAAAV